MSTGRGYMSRSSAFLFIAIAVAMMISIAYALNSLVGSINIVGTIAIGKNIEMIPQRVDIDLGVINASEGSKTYSGIAKLVVRNDTEIQVRVRTSTQPRGNISISISGLLVIEGGGKRYEINMPCLYSTGACVRILLLIPGYDAPMRIEKGEYNISLIVSWVVEGSGEGRISLSLDIIEAREAR